MAKHKAPTQVTIAPTEEQSAFNGFVERTWKPFAAIAVALAAFIIWSQASSESEKQASFDSWDGLTSTLKLDLFTGAMEATSEDVASLSADGEAGPWALYLAAVAHAKDRNWEEASSAIQRLQQEYPDHQLNTDKYEFDGADQPLSMAGNFARIASAQAAWASEHPQLVANPDLPADAPKVRINTAEGPIVVGLYTDRAPKHCENFLKLCREGFYDGTKIHRILPGRIIQGGDPNTKPDGDEALIGQGGPGYSIEEELTGLFHFEGVLAAARKPGETESSGSQFYISMGPVHEFDENYVVYGRVVEGLEIVKAIGEGEVDPPDRPRNMVELTSTEVL